MVTNQGILVCASNRGVDWERRGQPISDVLAARARVPEFLKSEVNNIDPKDGLGSPNPFVRASSVIYRLGSRG